MSNPDQPAEAPETLPTPGTEIRPTTAPKEPTQTPQPQPQVPNGAKKKGIVNNPIIVIGLFVSVLAVVYMLLPDQPISFPGNHDGIVKYTEKTYEKISMPASWQQYSKGENADPIDIGAADTGWTYSYSTGSGSNQTNYQDLKSALSTDNGSYAFDTAGSPDTLVATSEKQNLKLTATFKGQSVDVLVRELHVDE